MKKLLAIFCSIAILSVSLFTGGIFTSPVSAEGEETEERFIHNFSTVSGYEASKKYVNASGSNINLEYDYDEGALKASPKQTGVKANHQVRIDPVQGAKTVKVDEYPVVAVKIKFNNSANPRFGGVNAGTNKDMRPSGSQDSVFSTLQFAGTGKTADWQLLIWDGTSLIYDAEDSTTSKNFCGTYEAFICMLTDNSQTTTADDIYWIEWAGAFKSVDEVYEYEQEMVSPYFYDFTDKTTTEELIATDSANKRVQVGANTSLSYDAEKGALKIDATDGATTAGQFMPMPYLDKNTKVEKYPVVAFKVKVNNTARNFDRLFVGTTGRTVSGGNYNNDLGVMSNKPTGAWQLVIIDGTDLVYNPDNSNTKTWFDGTLGNMIIQLMADSTTATADDIWWVKWAGVFESVEDVYAYDGSPETPFFYDFTDKEQVEDVLSAGKVIVNEGGHKNTFAYSEENKALKATPTNSTADENRFYINSTTPTIATEYPYAAIKIKIANANQSFHGVAPGTNHGVAGKGALRFGYFGETLVATGDWQIILIDMTRINEADKTYFTGTWNSLHLKLNDSNGSCTDGVYIQWAGAFKTIEEVYAHDKEASPLIYNYTETDGYNAARTRISIDGTHGNVSYAYSEDYSAIKFTATDTAVKNHRVNINGCVTATNAKDRINIADFPVMAIKIRANTEFELNCLPYVAKYKNGTKATSEGNTADVPKFVSGDNTVTSDWKIITFDYSTCISDYIAAGTYDAFYWNWFMLFLTNDSAIPGGASAAAPEGQEWDIQWMGLFDSKESAYAYDEVCLEDVDRADTVTPADADTNVLFVGNDASADLLGAETKAVLRRDAADINIGHLTAADLNAAVANGTQNMQFTYMAKNNKGTYTDAKTNAGAVGEFAAWDYVFVGDTALADAVASLGAKVVPYTLTSGIEATGDVLDLNAILQKATTHYVAESEIKTDSGLTATGRYLAALGISKYLIDGYNAAEKNITVYADSAVIDTYLRYIIDGILLGDADNNETISATDIVSIRNHILGTATAANTDNADFDTNGSINIRDMVRLAVFVGSKTAG